VLGGVRFQPFRGFGSTYPGHLLPTDRNHWSDRYGSMLATAPTLGREVEFFHVAPRAPRGWAFLDDWQVDLTGTQERRVDPDGWSYAFDFIFLEFPPAVDSNKPGTGTFVRRRRWVRHRVPTSDLHKFSESAAPQAAAVAQRALTTATAMSPAAAAAAVGAEGSASATAGAMEVPVAASPRLSRPLSNTSQATKPQQHRWMEPAGRGEGSPLGGTQNQDSYEAVAHGNTRKVRAKRAALAARSIEEHAQSSPPVTHADDAASAGTQSTPRASHDPPERRLTPLERKKMVRSPILPLTPRALDSAFETLSWGGTGASIMLRRPSVSTRA
jgi:hypothetical protein